MNNVITARNTWFENAGDISSLISQGHLGKEYDRYKFNLEFPEIDIEMIEFRLEKKEPNEATNPELAAFIFNHLLQEQNLKTDSYIVDIGDLESFIMDEEPIRVDFMDSDYVTTTLSGKEKIYKHKEIPYEFNWKNILTVTIEDLAWGDSAYGYTRGFALVNRAYYLVFSRPIPDGVDEIIDEYPDVYPEKSEAYFVQQFVELFKKESIGFCEIQDELELTCNSITKFKLPDDLAMVGKSAIVEVEQTDDKKYVKLYFFESADFQCVVLEYKNTYDGDIDQYDDLVGNPALRAITNFYQGKFVTLMGKYLEIFYKKEIDSFIKKPNELQISFDIDPGFFYKEPVCDTPLAFCTRCVEKFPGSYLRLEGSGNYYCPNCEPDYKVTKQADVNKKLVVPSHPKSIYLDIGGNGNAEITLYQFFNNNGKAKFAEQLFNIPVDTTTVQEFVKEVIIPVCTDAISSEWLTKPEWWPVIYSGEAMPEDEIDDWKYEDPSLKSQ